LQSAKETPSPIQCGKELQRCRMVPRVAFGLNDVERTGTVRVRAGNGTRRRRAGISAVNSLGEVMVNEKPTQGGIYPLLTYEPHRFHWGRESRALAVLRRCLRPAPIVDHMSIHHRVHSPSAWMSCIISADSQTFRGSLMGCPQLSGHVQSSNRPRAGILNLQRSSLIAMMI